MRYFFVCFNLQSGNLSVGDSSRLKITSSPDTLDGDTQSVTLRVNETESLPGKGLIYEWKCRKYNDAITEHVDEFLTNIYFRASNIATLFIRHL